MIELFPYYTQLDEEFKQYRGPVVEPSTCLEAAIKYFETWLKRNQLVPFYTKKRLFSEKMDSLKDYTRDLSIMPREWRSILNSQYKIFLKNCIRRFKYCPFIQTLDAGYRARAKCHGPVPNFLALSRARAVGIPKFVTISKNPRLSFPSGPARAGEFVFRYTCHWKTCPTKQRNRAVNCFWSSLTCGLHSQPIYKSARKGNNSSLGRSNLAL